MSNEAHHALHLLIGAASVPKEVVPGPNTEIFVLTPESAPEALEKIFAADAIAVWSELLGK